ncbi:sugar ABC transporter ATP-binding protein [Caballeronia sp. LP006]|uniref:sugar ABC transporter ATP-binding protein n=1 Tax=unclassified Caballeronia TaxID=2646786 RepID=UPI002027E4F3|nr:MULTISPECIES: sugar ABC transporter ATP-binding protein [unclassified Caballeronia]MDR5826840.1 sugar ABC transporter ATP-binding protein [Caballeronia sp. LP006]
MADMSSNEYILRTHDVVKRYKAVVALDRVSVNIRRGTIHGLLGENGAGKSTLVRLISGQTAPTEGSITFDGEDMQGSDVKQMEARGVFLVTQEPMIVDSMSVADNLMLGRWPVKRGLLKQVDQRAQMQSVEIALEGTGFDPRMPARLLSAVAKRKLNILRALHSGGKLLILDEPTTALTLADREHLFDFMRSLKARGVTFVFISHYNEEILDICDGVSVLRNGKLAGEHDDLSQIDSDGLSELVIGRDVPLFYRDREATRARGAGDAAGAAWLVEDLVAPGVDVERFSIAPGEIVGFAGLPGSGAKEFALALFGLNRAKSGRVSHDGRTSVMPNHPGPAFERGIAYLSDDRHRDGLVGLQSIAHNITLSSLADVSHGGVIDAGAERHVVKRYFEHFRVKAATPEVLLGTLSGGNQQKVCLGRVLATSPRLLILDEPTRGIDVGVKEEVHRIIDTLTREGLSVIVITSDLDEMVRMVDRVCVFVGGRIEREYTGAQIEKDAILQSAFNVESASVQTEPEPLASQT